MSDVKNAYDEIIDFMSNETEKTLLLCGISDEEKGHTLLQALNNQGKLKGLVYLINTLNDGMRDFFENAQFSRARLPKKYDEAIRFKNLKIAFNKLTNKSSANRYANIAFDFIIVWPTQSITKDEQGIQMLKEMAERQKTRKIIYLTFYEPWCNPKALEPIVDRIIKLDCENDNPKEYQRILSAYEEHIQEQQYYTH